MRKIDIFNNVDQVKSKLGNKTLMLKVGTDNIRAIINCLLDRKDHSHNEWTKKQIREYLDILNNNKKKTHVEALCYKVEFLKRQFGISNIYGDIAEVARLNITDNSTEVDIQPDRLIIEAGALRIVLQGDMYRLESAVQFNEIDKLLAISILDGYCNDIVALKRSAIDGLLEKLKIDWEESL